MKFKILLVIGILAIVTVALLFALLKEDVKVPNVNEAFALLEEKYSADISNNYSVINITNGWKFEFLKIEGNCSLECIKRYIYFEVYKNGSIVRSENSTKITIIENENGALNYVLFRFPEFKKINKCVFEEKLMCHEDIIIEKIDERRWNITFMNESKGCNNECVIRRYYSFLVKNDGKIVKHQKERVITLNDFAEDIRKCDENLTFIGSKWWANPEEAPPDGILTRWYFDEIKKSINITTYGETRVMLYESPSIEAVIRGTYIIDAKPYLLLIDPRSKIVYRINKTEFIYNVILEKFSTKTINNESDALEAFERYLELFPPEPRVYLGCYPKGVMWKIDPIKRLSPFVNRWQDFNLSIKRIMSGGEGFQNRLKPTIIKKNNYWTANVSAFCVGYKDIQIVDYNTLITKRGAVIILNKTETIINNFLFYPI